VDYSKSAMVSELNHNINFLMFHQIPPYHNTKLVPYTTHYRYILKDIGHDVHQIAAALKMEFGKLEQDTAQILKDIGHDVHQIAAVLSDEFFKLENDTAHILKNVKFNVHEFAEALRVEFILYVR